MATIVEEFNQAKQIIRKYGLDGRTLKLALVSGIYVFDATDVAWAEISANEISGTGYVAGGATVAGVTVSAAGVIDATDVAWAGATITFRRAILYVSGVLGALTNPVLLSYLYDNTPADVAVVGTTFTHIWNAAGIIRNPA